MAENYTNELMNEMWEYLADGFCNLGRISPDADIDTIPDLKQANHDMVEYIISQLKIGKDSYILDLSSGRGMYTVMIAKRTGCKFIGTEINEQYMEDSRTLAEQHGVGEQGEFIYSSWAKMNEKVKEKKYTHVLSLGAMIYGHDVLETIFNDIADCCDANTKVFIWDFVRKVDWKELADANSHMKLEYPMASKEVVVEKIKNSRLMLTEFQDFTRYIIPGYKIILRECRKRDPEKRTLTYHLSGHAFMDGRLAYVIFHLKLKQ